MVFFFLFVLACFCCCIALHGVVASRFEMRAPATQSWDGYVIPSLHTLLVGALVRALVSEERGFAMLLER